VAPADAARRGAPGPLILYGRRYCHLCEDMLAALRVQLGADFPVELVDVDSDPRLEERYGELVPLLMHGDTELCRYRYEPEKLAAYLAETR
jgi:Glutaredoxin-like domain (DUF836)